MIFGYVWELYWNLTFTRHKSRLCAVCRSKNNFLFASLSCLRLHGHLVKNNNKECGVLDSLRQQFVFYSRTLELLRWKRTKHNILFLYIMNLEKVQTSIYRSNCNLSLPAVNVLLQLLLFVLGIHVLHDTRSLII